MKVESEILLKDIKFIEFGITSSCNLRCPLCIQVKNKIYEKKSSNLDIGQLMAFLDKIPNVERANLEGNYSDPLLHPNIFDLIKYLKDRNIKIIISTNGSFGDGEFWKKLGDFLNDADIVRFAIDGSTQELYEKYRVGGKLNKVLESHRSLKSNSSCRTVLQNIVFEHNLEDKDRIQDLFVRENFDYLNYIKSYMSDYSGKELKPEPKVHRYYNLFNRVISDESSNRSIVCDSFVRKEIYINHLGNIYLCGSHDSGDYLKSNININSPIEEVLDFINKQYQNRGESSVCRSDCNLLCYAVGRQYPDTLIDKLNNVTEQKYFCKDVHEDHEQLESLLDDFLKKAIK